MRLFRGIFPVINCLNRNSVTHTLNLICALHYIEFLRNFIVIYRQCENFWQLTEIKQEPPTYTLFTNTTIFSFIALSYSYKNEIRAYPALFFTHEVNVLIHEILDLKFKWTFGWKYAKLNKIMQRGNTPYLLQTTETIRLFVSKE